MTTAAGPAAPRFGDLLGAEWIKLRSLRSSSVAMAVTVVLVVGIGVLVCVAIAATATASTTVNDPTSASLVGVSVAQLSVAVFGVLVVTSEYSSGTIKVSLMAVPRRGRLLASKSVVVVAVAVVVGEVVAWLSFGAGQAILSGSAPSASVSQPGVVRAVAGAGLLLGLLALLGSALGWLLRSAAGAISIVVAVLFVLPAVLQAIPGRAGTDIQHFWPTSAGARILIVSQKGQPAGEPGAWVGLGILVLFVAVVLAAAAVNLLRRDA